MFTIDMTNIKINKKIIFNINNEKNYYIIINLRNN